MVALTIYAPAPSEAERLWKGEKPKSGARLLEKVHEIRKGTKPHAIIVRETDPFDPEFVHAAFYPRLEHAERFASARVDEGGPAQTFPGSVGGLRALVTPEMIVIDYIQGSFKTGKIISPSKGVSRTLASEYGGWRHHLLNWLFSQSSRQQISYMLPPNQMGGLNNAKILREVASKYGYRHFYLEYTERGTPYAYLATRKPLTKDELEARIRKVVKEE